MGSLQDVEYEGLHQICFGSSTYGHKSEFCPSWVVIPLKEAMVTPAHDSMVVVESVLVVTDQGLVGRSLGHE